MVFLDYNDNTGDVLEDVGVDPTYTPVDNLPVDAQWALAEHFYNLENYE